MARGGYGLVTSSVASPRNVPETSVFAVALYQSNVSAYGSSNVQDHMILCLFQMPTPLE
ncbi:UNVERIFIED_CONTAM: hypothetical protein K2H54_029674, partial [Gekko kuhli]